MRLSVAVRSRRERFVMKRLFGTVALTVLSLALVGCGDETSSFSMTALDEGSGVHVVAENASKGSSATSESAITIGEADTLIVSPLLDSGTVHVAITSSKGNVVYDKDVSGKSMEDVPVLPDSYTVSVSTDAADGEVTIFAQNLDELTKQNEDLAQQLDSVDFDANFGG